MMVIDCSSDRVLRKMLRSEKKKILASRFKVRCVRARKVGAGSIPTKSTEMYVGSTAARHGRFNIDLNQHECSTAGGCQIAPRIVQSDVSDLERLLTITASSDSCTQLKACMRTNYNCNAVPMPCGLTHYYAVARQGPTMSI